MIKYVIANKGGNMEKRYTTYLGELEKLIDSGKLNEEHEYYELYMYIKQLYKPLIIKQLIEKKINTILSTIGNKYIEEIQNIPKNIESVPIPTINQGIERIKSENLEKLVRIDNIEQTKKYIIETIYEEILNALNQTESQYEKSAKQNLNKLISDCKVALTGIRYHGMRFIEEDKINNELIKDFTEKLNDDDFFSLYQLEKDETSKIEMIIEEKQINESLTNSKIIVTEFIINKIINKIQRIDEEIEQQLDQNTRLFLQRENILTEEKGQIHINITTERLREIKISEKELFELLNVRCRLNDIKEKLENGKEIKYEVCEKDKKILKRIMKDIELSEIELSSLELELKIIYKQFKQAKKEELKRIRSEISQLEENKKTIMTQTIRELFQDQSNNLELLCRPSSPQILSAKGAIYIVNTLTYLGKKRNEELINFLTNEKVAKLSSREENIIENITSRWINNYIEHQAQEQPESSQLEDAHQLIKRRKNNECNGQ